MKKSSDDIHEKYKVTLEQCLTELSYVDVAIIIYKKLSEDDDSNGFFNFFYYTQVAFFNEIFTRMMRVLDKHDKSCNYWFIWKYKRNSIISFSKENKLSLKTINELADKIILLRKKIHFHLDQEYISAPQEIWKQADITGDFLDCSFQILYKILKHLYFLEYSNRYRVYTYNGDDIHLILSACKKSGYFHEIFFPGVMKAN